MFEKKIAAIRDCRLRVNLSQWLVAKLTRNMVCFPDIRRFLYDNGHASGNGLGGGHRALRGGNGSRHSRCGFRVLQKPILGTFDGEHWHCRGVRSFLLEIPQASMKQGAIAVRSDSSQ